MANETFDALIPDALIHLQGAPEPLIESLVKQTVRDFCRFSTCWREWVEFETDDDEDEFQLSIPSRSEIVSVHAVHDGDGFINPVGSDYPGVEQETRSNPSCESGYLLLRPNRIKVVPTPSQEHLYRCLVSLKPTPAATGCPGWILDQWREGLVWGVLARAYEIPNKPWSDASQSNWNWKKYRHERGKARITTQKQGTTRSRRAQPRSFF